MSHLVASGNKPEGITIHTKMSESNEVEVVETEGKSLLQKVEAFLASETKTVEEAVIHLTDLFHAHKALVPDPVDPVVVDVEVTPVETVENPDEAETPAETVEPKEITAPGTPAETTEATA